MSKRTAAEIVGAIALTMLSVTNAAFADRVATTVITNIAAAVSPVLSQNMAAPVATFPTATSTGSVYAGTLYFEVVAVDSTGATTIGSNLMGTTSPGASNGYNITWPAVPGAVAYRTYFSTSTPVALIQYFNATTTTGFDFTSTSSPVYAPSGIPTVNTATVIRVLPNGSSYFNGGNFAIGTSSPVANFQVAAASSTNSATTTAEFGASGRTKGTCIKMYNDAGTAIYLHATSTSGILYYSTTDCASVSGF